jgi:GDP-4-dehydro-6-deoxy-D-mannose reductase
MRYLITGAKGFIGKHLLNLLFSKGEECFILNNDSSGVLNSENFSQFNDNKIDIVIHLASKTYVPESWEIPEDYLRSNLLGTINLLEFCRNNKCKLIFISSYIYGNPEYLPIDENHKISVANPYSLSKRLSEEMCEFYFNNFDFPIILVRPFNIYGPGQKNDFLIPHILTQLLNDKTVSVKDFLPKRDYLYIDDFVEAIYILSKYEIGFEIFNLGYGKSYSVKQIIDLSQNVCGTNKSSVSLQEKRLNEISDVIADISKITKHTGWQPKIDLQAGIHKLVSNMKSNQ